MERLRNKVAIVTGAASNMGKYSALSMANEGASVVIADINLTGAQEVADEIKAKGGSAIAVSVDISDPQLMEAMIETTKKEFGRLDILHNNAARLNFAGDVDIVNMDINDWDQTFIFNLRSVMLGSKYAIPLMLESGGGSIINVSSTSALSGDLSKTAYGAAKAGVISLTRYIATQYGKQNIRCNAISPGMVLDPETIPKMGDAIKTMMDLFEGHKLTPRIGIPQDVANLAVFLASDESEFITGQVINCDGGMMAHHPAVKEMRDTDLGW